jgi:hypothetical protein
MKAVFICCAVLLSAAPCAAQIGNTDCSQDVFGNWQCRSMKGNFQLYKSPFKPDTWEMVPAPGSASPRCTIRRDLLGNIQSTCN